MKKNGFTLVELLAVLVILAILGGLAAPNIINLMQSGKEKSFISDAEEMVSTATYMYKEMRARDSIDDTTEYKLYMKSLNGNIPETDPYGYIYDKDISYISFKEPGETEENSQRKIKAFFKSCKKDKSGNVEKCHCIDLTQENDDATDIKNSDIVDCN